MAPAPRIPGGPSRSAVAVGVGGRADEPDGLARSFEDTRALAIRESARTTDGVTVFDELANYRIIAPGDRTDETEHFIQQWIGPLVDYDAAHGTDLVHTLSAYLESGGSHHTAAEELSSTAARSATASSASAS